MTFLELVNAVRENCGASGPPLTTLQGTLSQQNLRIKNWVNLAWRDVQNKHRNWSFMVKNFQFNTVANQGAYAYDDVAVNLTSFANWKKDSLRSYPLASGWASEQILIFRDWPTFRDLYLFANMRDIRRRPIEFTADPLKVLNFGPTPDDVYVINGQYYKASSQMSADDDVPDVIPDEFHNIIVWGAMQKYGFFEAAPDVLSRGKTEYGIVMAQLEYDYLPKISGGSPLA